MTPQMSVSRPSSETPGGSYRGVIRSMRLPSRPKRLLTSLARGPREAQIVALPSCFQRCRPCRLLRCP
eukprot:7164128-Pyramimonas_sp.AAC.1